MSLSAGNQASGRVVDHLLFFFHLFDIMCLNTVTLMHLGYTHSDNFPKYNSSDMVIFEKTTTG